MLGKGPARGIKEVLEDHTERLMSLPGVTGTASGFCEGEPCIKVYVIRKTPDLNGKIPDRIEGYPVRVEETGRIRALPEDDR